MEELQDDLKIYSEEVRDVLSAPPKAIFKWGNTILLFFIFLLGLLSWFIKYPDIIRAEVLITTQTPPEKLVARTTGKIQKIWIKNQEKVTANTPIAIIENAEYGLAFSSGVAATDAVMKLLNPGDEVIVFGDQNPLWVMSDAIGTIPYEVLTGISRRVPRVYFQE